MFSLTSSLDSLIDTLNDVVYVADNPSLDSVNELKAAVSALTIIDGSYNDREELDFHSKMFFRYYDSLVWKSDLIKLASHKVNYLISSPNC